MCISAAVAIAGVAAVASIGVGYMGMQQQKASAKYNRQAMEYELALRNKDAERRRGLAQAEALETEQLRRADFDATRSAAFAAIGASGIGEHISFFSGIDPEQQGAFLRETRNVRLSLSAEETQIADEIAVNDYGGVIGRYNASAQSYGSKLNFLGNSFQTAMNFASFYGAYKTPSAAAAGTGDSGIAGFDTSPAADWQDSPVLIGGRSGGRSVPFYDN
jgi:hypothetical protein